MVPRDVERTKLRLQTAATVEFAEHGLHGTTVERIAVRAGVNKERLYAYFGDKSALFVVVIRLELNRLARAVPLVITSNWDAGKFAGDAFDYQQTHPQLGRLLLWEGLTDTGIVPDELARSVLYADKIRTLAKAQEEGLIDDALEPAHLMFLLIALASWWSAVPQLARMMGTGDPTDSAERDRRRHAVVLAGRRISERPFT